MKAASPYKGDEAGKLDPMSTWSVYRTICENFKPVLRRFFTENFKDTAQMFQNRLAYTRSVAASSIVGYILGLGDRHVHNILIDMGTAELVHIDLGIAFDQGQLLPTPETVPFRLTRDIVDGMGVSGVEGVFRRCCESTLRVMRLNTEGLIMLLEVFLYDPLCMWRLDSAKAQQAQNDEDLVCDAVAEAPPPAGTMLPASRASFYIIMIFYLFISFYFACYFQRRIETDLGSLRSRNPQHTGRAGVAAHPAQARGHRRWPHRAERRGARAPSH
jgi:phosphatidylinositol kinase/protein kinase (PI-3  family)